MFKPTTVKLALFLTLVALSFGPLLFFGSGPVAISRDAAG
jgi:hypothetical protein